MRYRIEYADGRCCNFANSRKDLLDWLKLLKDEPGGSWFDIDKIPFEDRHFYETPDCDYQFCLGVPQSFKSLRNVVLENVKTAEQMLFAYESYQQGMTNKVKLISYSHGKKGMDEYERNKKRYRAK